MAAVPDGTACTAGLALRVKFGAAFPVPLRATVCGEPVAVSATDRVALKVATEVGEKVMEMVQLRQEQARNRRWWTGQRRWCRSQ